MSFAATISQSNSHSAATTRRGANIALWSLQIVLALLFVFAGVMKLVMPVAELTRDVPLPGLFLRFIGVVELVGGLGLFLPRLLRLNVRLIPLAAAGLIIIMSGAIGTSMATGKVAPALMPFTTGVLLLIVAYGRGRNRS